MFSRKLRDAISTFRFGFIFAPTSLLESKAFVTDPFELLLRPFSTLPTGDGSFHRTYKTVNVRSIEQKVISITQSNQNAFLQSGFNVLLDNKVLRTPNNSPLIVPTHALALAIAAEWEWQVSLSFTNS